MNDPEEARERAYEQGEKAAYRSMLGLILGELGDDAQGNAARWRLERMTVVSKLRSFCEDYGDNDWPDNLHLADVIEKHIDWSRMDDRRLDGRDD